VKIILISFFFFCFGLFINIFILKNQKALTNKAMPWRGLLHFVDPYRVENSLHFNVFEILAPLQD
jgi:hypothetical protein